MGTSGDGSSALSPTPQMTHPSSRDPGETVRRRSQEIEARLASQFATAHSRPPPPMAALPIFPSSGSTIFTWANGTQPFIRPEPRQAKVINATIIENGIRTQFSAIFCTLADSRPLIFAFTRARLGRTYLGESEVALCQCEPMAYADYTTALPECVDLLPRLIRAIISSMHPLEISAITREQLEAWNQNLHSPDSSIRTEEPCRNCGRLFSVTLQNFAHLRDVASGIRCSHLNHVYAAPSGNYHTPTEMSPTSSNASAHLGPTGVTAPTPEGPYAPRARTTKPSYSTFVGLGD